MENSENKIKITNTDVKKAVNEAIGKAKGRLMDMTGDNDDHMVIEPVTEPSIEDIPADASVEGNNQPIDGAMDTEMGPEGALPDNLTPSTPPAGLIEVMGAFDSVKSKLSKLAAEEQNEDIQNAIYAYYDKINKLTLEMIKDFKIVH